MSWYIGQDIVCVRTHTLGLVVEGDTFNIKSLKQSPYKCGHTHIDVGLTTTKKNIECGICGHISKSNGTAWFSEILFAPLDTLADISELTEVLETTKPFEV